jgi:ferritin
MISFSDFLIERASSDITQFNHIVTLDDGTSLVTNLLMISQEKFRVVSMKNHAINGNYPTHGNVRSAIEQVLNYKLDTKDQAILDFLNLYSNCID